MPDIRTTEGLMVWIMNRLAEVFGPRAVLRGGMVPCVDRRRRDV